MALSNIARRILNEAAQHPLRLAPPPDKPPTVACRLVLNSLLKQGYVEECAAPMEYIGLGWRRQDGAWTAIRVTDAGLAVIGAVSATNTVLDEAERAVATDMAQEPDTVLSALVPDLTSCNMGRVPPTWLRKWQAHCWRGEGEAGDGGWLGQAGCGGWWGGGSCGVHRSLDRSAPLRQSS